MIDGTSTVRRRHDDQDLASGPELPATRGADEEARLAAWIARDDEALRVGTPRPSRDGDCADVGSPHHSFDRCQREVIAHAQLFVKGDGDACAIDPNDVRQGALADCYALAPIQGLAQSPKGMQRIRDMIHARTEPNGKIVYDVTLWVPDPNGKGRVEKTFTVPNSFVLGHVRTGDVDAATGGKEIWPLVLEAAIAQACGGADAIADGGRPADAIAMLTGKEPEIKQFRWIFGYSADDIRRDLAADRMVVLSTIPKENKSDPPLPFGLTDSHAYVVKAVVNVNGEPHVVLTDPWGHHEVTVPVAELRSLVSEAAVGER
jgi:hypothetical protein